MGYQTDRLELAKSFGATDIVTERGVEAVERVRQLTGGYGVRPVILEGRIEPGRVFDSVTNIDGVPGSYRAMDERKAIKVMIKF